MIGWYVASSKCPVPDPANHISLPRVSFVFSLQTWLAESSEQKKTAATPAYMSVFMSCTCRFISFPLSSLSVRSKLILRSYSSDGAGRCTCME